MVIVEVARAANIASERPMAGSTRRPPEVRTRTTAPRTTRAAAVDLSMLSRPQSAARNETSGMHQGMKRPVRSSEPADRTTVSASSTVRPAAVAAARPRARRPQRTSTATPVTKAAGTR